VTPATRERLFGFGAAFEDPATVGMVVAVGIAVGVAPLALRLLVRAGKVGGPLEEEIRERHRSWLIIIPLIAGPILLGAAWTILGVLVLSLLCYREFARATGLFREKSVSLAVTLGILLVAAAAADHWYGLFVALFPLTIAAIAAVGILADRPRGYIQRVGLGVMGFALFGCALMHLAYFANDARYRPMLLMIFLAVEMNDIFAFCVGKPFGRRKLAPNTSPGKTVEGAAGALVLTTLLVWGVGAAVFRGTELDRPGPLILLGAIISIVGQLGDLMLSSVKRDLGIKDMGTTIPGHGGLLDRFNSLILVAPAAFHFIGYFLGIGLDQEARIFTGGE
jgi:phosphatidate cytidylyltransferase